MAAKKAKKFLKRMKTKLLILFFSAVAVFIVLIGRVVYIGIAKGEEYSEEVLSQKSYDSLEIPYERGDIVDRNGNVLATNEKIYNLILEPKNILQNEADHEGMRETTQKALEQYFGLTKEKFDSSMENNDSYYQNVMQGLSYTEVKAFRDFCETDDGKDIIGIQFEESYQRKYPNGSLACHILGYTVSGNVGQGGIEGYYSSYLNGTNGKIYGYLTADNTVESVTIPAVDGYTVVSTIDLNIQKIIEENIASYMETTGAEKIGILAMDPDTGEILGMACSHKYDPNHPMDTDALRNMTVVVTEELDETTEDPEADSEEGSEEDPSSEDSSESEDETEEPEEPREPEKITYQFDEMTDEEFHKTIDSLSNNQRYEALDSVWRNYCISDIYEPGSTYKTFTVAGALEDNVVYDGQTFYCDGYEVVIEGTSPIYCHNRNGDGTLTLQGALEQSCNDSLMQIARLEGASVFDKYQEMFNFGSVTGVDLSGEASGMKYSADSLNATELATSSFGQSVNVTMIQMGAAFCSVINGGNYYTPHVVKQIVDENGSMIEEMEPELVRKTISKETSDMMKSYLQGVVENGTGKRAAVEGYTIGGKTGTAEKLPRGNGKYILSFIGFSPVENPQIMVYVIVDQPHVDSQSTSGAGALLFHDVMEDLLPYLNIYQSNDTTVVYDGKDEPIGSVFGNEEDTAGEGNSEEDNTGGENTEASSSEDTVSEESSSEEETEPSSEETPVHEE